MDRWTVALLLLWRETSMSGPGNLALFNVQGIQQSCGQPSPVWLLGVNTDSFILLIVMGWIPAAERSLEQAARSCPHLRFLLKSVWGDCQSMRAHPALDPLSHSHGFLGRLSHWSWLGHSSIQVSRRGDSCASSWDISWCKGDWQQLPWCTPVTRNGGCRASPHTCHVRSCKTDKRLKKSLRFH